MSGHLIRCLMLKIKLLHYCPFLGCNQVISSLYFYFQFNMSVNLEGRSSQNIESHFIVYLVFFTKLKLNFVQN